MCLKWIINKIFLKKRTIGTIEIIRPEYAYVVTNDKSIPDILIPFENLNYALDGDVVMVKYWNDKNKEWKLIGEVTKILRRGTKKVIGVLDKRKNGYTFEITSFKNYYDIEVLNFDDKNIDLFPIRAEARIEKYPSKKGKLICEIKEIFGPIGDHESEIKTIIKEYNLNNTFSEKVNEESKLLSKNIDFNEKTKIRKDFRKDFTVTIDPAKAKDFDDAISIKKLDNNNYRIGVHIADVSYFVKENSELDKEAYKRNTSVYLIDRVIPMLPEVLCNDLCSLLPNEDRLTMSVVFEINEKHEICDTWIGEAIINSDFRLTYDEAQQIIDNKNDINNNNLSFLLNTAKFLKGERIKNGAIDFNYESIDFGVDENNDLNIENSKALDSHLLVEEFMLLANKTIGEYVRKIQNKNKKNNIGCIFRVHPKPEKWKIIEFSKIIKCFGFSVDTNEDNLAENINAFLKQIKGNANEHILTTLAIRVMQKAYYSIEPVGHYGLAFDYYTHFTSPIRRYIDIAVHRLLKKYLHKEYSFDKEKCYKLCEYALEKENLAVNAERDSIKFKQIEYLKKFEGEKVTGIITGLTDWGIFFELEETKCEGLMRFSNVKNDVLIFDKERMSTYGKFTGTIYRIGDKREVILKKCNLKLKTIDLSFL